MPSEPSPIDFVVPVFNDFDTLSACVEALLLHKGPHDRLFVVDDGSSDPRAPAILAELAGRVDRVLRLPHGGKHAAVTQGANEGAAPLVCVVDADTVVPTGFTKTLRPWFADPAVEAVDVIPAVANPNASLWTRLASFERELLAVRPTSFGALFAIRRSVLESLPMRDCRSPQFELDLRLKQRGSLRFARQPVVASQEPITLTATFRRKRRWVLGMLEGLALNGIPVPPALLLCLLETLIFLSALLAPLKPALLIAPSLLLGVWLLKSVWLAARYGLQTRTALGYPLFMLVLAVAASDALIRFRLGLSVRWR